MNWVPWLIVAVLSFCLSTLGVFAEQAEQGNESVFGVMIQPAEQHILLNQTAAFQVTIRNNRQISEQFRLYSPDVEWDVRTQPAADRIITIPPGLSRTVTIFVRPLYVDPGVFGVTLHIKAANSDVLKKESLYISVSSTQPLETYLPAITAELKLGENIDPRNEVGYTLELSNKNRKQLGNLDIKIRSNLINDETQISLGPLESKSVPFVAQLNPFTKPQDDLLKVAIQYKEEDKTYHFDAKPIPFEIIAYGGIEEEKNETSDFFKYTQSIHLKNTANDKRETYYKVPTTFLNDIFTTTTPVAFYEKEEGQPVLKFPVILNIGEETTLVVVKNYRPLVWLFLCILVLLLLYRYYQSPIVLTKQSRVVAKQEGGASEIKVIMIVRNRSRKPIQDITILDKIPNLALIVREFEAGTLEPSQILKHEEKGTLLKWKIDQLDKEEERIISYRIKTRLVVLGSVQMPIAVAKYRTVSGKEKVVNSSVEFFEG